MKKRQFILLIVGSLLLWSGNGWLPLLPVYASQLGAQTHEIGNYLPMIGWLSDRMGRKWLLNLCFLLGMAGLAILAAAAAQWQFCITAGLTSLMLNGVGAVGSALVTDSVPRAALGRGMSLFNATTWIGGIIGMSLTGLAIQGLGAAVTFIGAAFLPLLALGLLIPVWRMQVRGAR